MWQKHLTKIFPKNFSIILDPGNVMWPKHTPSSCLSPVISVQLFWRCGGGSRENVFCIFLWNANLRSYIYGPPVHKWCLLSNICWVIVQATSRWICVTTMWKQCHCYCKFCIPPPPSHIPNLTAMSPWKFLRSNPTECFLQLCHFLSYLTNRIAMQNDPLKMVSSNAFSWQWTFIGVDRGRPCQKSPGFTCTLQGCCTYTYFRVVKFSDIDLHCRFAALQALRWNEGKFAIAIYLPFTFTFLQ